MVTLLQAFLGQFEILLIGITLFLVRCLLTGEKIDIYELCPPLANKYFVAYVIFLWFGLLTWLTWYTQKPRFGIWSNFFEISPIFGWAMLLAVFSLNIVIIYKKRFS